MRTDGDVTVSSESALIELFDQISDRLHAGDRIDLAALQAEYPEAAKQLEQLLPAVELLAELGFATRTRQSACLLPRSMDLPHQVSTDAEQAGVLGDFRILRELGRGGMGIVYEATQLSLDRRVALKVLPFAAVVDPRGLQRFKNEAQAAARLRHPNIVGIHFVGCERSVHFYAMDLVDGESLAQIIGRLRQCQDSADAARHGGSADAPGQAGQRPARRVRRAATRAKAPAAGRGSRRIGSTRPPDTRPNPSW